MKKLFKAISLHARKIETALSFIFLFGSGVVAVYAQGATGVPAPIKTPAQLQTALCTFIAYFFWFVIAISIMFALVAAFHYVTAGDDTEKTSKARRTLTYAAVGVAVALISTQFPTIVGTILGNTTTLIPANCTLLGG